MKLTPAQANELARIARRHGPLDVRPLGEVVGVGLATEPTTWLVLDADGRALSTVRAEVEHEPELPEGVSDEFFLPGERRALGHEIAVDAIEGLLDDGEWRIRKEVAAGIGAGEATVKRVLEEPPERFTSLTGDAARAVGRRSHTVMLQLVREDGAA